jgi:trigger factor
MSTGKPPSAPAGMTGHVHGPDCQHDHDHDHDHGSSALPAPRAQARTQRSLRLRQRQEVQEVPRRHGMTGRRARATADPAARPGAPP